MIHWLNTVEFIDDHSHKIQMTSVKPCGSVLIEHLSELDQLTLRQLSRQGWMTVGSHALAFNLSEQRSAAVLRHLCTLGIVSNGQQFYSICDHYSGSVYRILNRKGWL